MNRLLLVLLALGALVLGLVWLRGSTREPRAPALVDAAAKSAGSAPTSLSSAPFESPSPVEGEETEPRADGPLAEPEVEPPSLSARQGVASAYEEELAQAHWVEGTVRFPANTPADEELFVVADGKDFEHGANHRVQVGRDGTFRVAFSKKSLSGWLDIEGRYLFLKKKLRWRRADVAPIVLEPEVGGCIAGRLIPPEGVAPENVGGSVSLFEENRVNRGTRSVVAPDLVYEFGGLPESSAYHLGYVGESFVSRSVELKVERGKTRVMDLELRPGVELAGRTLDGARKPLAGVQVQASVETHDLWRLFGDHTTESGADGSFRIRGLPPGTLSVQASLEGYESTSRSLGLLAAGDVRQDLDLVLSRGQQIAGQVVWPDGSPAEATVTIELEQPQRWSGLQPDDRSETAADGAFHVTGLGEGPFRVVASATKREEVLVEDERTGREHTKRQRARFLALAEHVPAGTTDLRLVLSTGFALSGRVVDERGASVADFRVTARGSTASGMMTADKSVSQVFRDTDGDFTLEGLVQGEWDLTATANGRARSESVRVTVPGGAPPLLVLPAEARVRGVVLDPSGAPVGGARVQLENDMGWEVVTDEHATFVVDQLPASSLKLVAQGPGWAPSLACVLELAAGQEVDDVRLQLRAGGTITGEYFDHGDRGGSVRLFQWDTSFFETLGLDADGRFEARNVPPGEVDVTLETADGLELAQEVQVAAGETVHVRFTPEGLHRIRLHGRVHAGGEPLAGASVDVRAFSETSSRYHSGETDSAGAYDLTVLGAGDYWFSVRWGHKHHTSWDTQVAVPDEASFAFDLSIPVGRISGRVSLEDGRGLVAFPVEAQTVEGADGRGSCTTGEDGRYELLVPAGTYMVGAGGNTSGMRESGRSLVAACVEGVAVAENAHVRGIDLVLAEGGTLEGVVRLADGPLAGFVTIWSRTEGEEPEALEWCENGRFRVLGVAPGKHLIGASGEALATSRWVEVEIEAGGVEHVELELVPAAQICVRIVDASGAPTQAEIEVRGKDGSVQTGGTDEEGNFFTDHLLAGSYTVRAQGGGKSAERALSITGSEGWIELEVVLR